MSAEQIAGRPLLFDSAGGLLPWTSWEAALDLEMRFYAHTDVIHNLVDAVRAT